MAFGNIINDEMQLSTLGHAAKKCWLEIPAHFPFVRLNEYVIMPNHAHGIIEIVQTQDFASHVNKFGPQSKNLASIIRGFKIGVTKFANIHNISFTWHPGYHDHIVRNDNDLNRIQEYIQNNPLRWDIDKENPKK